MPPIPPVVPTMMNTGKNMRIATAAKAVRIGSRTPAMAAIPMNSQSQAEPYTRLNTSASTTRAVHKSLALQERVRAWAAQCTGCGHISQV